MEASTSYFGNNPLNMTSEKPKRGEEQRTDRNENQSQEDVGQSEFTPSGQFVSDKVDDLLAKSGQKVNAKTKSKDAQKTVKPSPRGEVTPQPDAENPAGSRANLLGADVLNTPLDESPSKTRATSQQQKQRQPITKSVPTSSPYLQTTVMKGPSPRTGGGSKGGTSKQFL